MIMAREAENTNTVKAELGRHPALREFADELQKKQPNATLFDLVDEINLELEKRPEDNKQLQELLAEANRLKDKHGESISLTDNQIRPGDRLN